MIKRTFAGILMVTTVIGQIAAQGVEKETVKTKSAENNLTISETGMYGGTKSEKARDYYNQALELDNAKDHKGAKKSYLKAIKEDPNYVEAYDNLGLTCRRLGELDNAIEYYSKSIELYPNGITAHQNLAVVYGLQQNMPAAVAEYKEILRISPTDAEGYFGLANTYMVMSKFDEALENGMKALDIYKKEDSHHLADGYYLVGLIFYYQGNIDSAKEYVLIALEKGANVHQQIKDELLGGGGNTKGGGLKLETPEDYANTEKMFIEGYNWLFSSPADEEPEQRKAVSAFLMQWVSGSPTVTIELSQDVVTYLDCSECLMIFMGGWTKYALESKQFDNKLMGNISGTMAVLDFYKRNKKALGTNKAIEKLQNLEDDGKLKSHIKSKM